jgi:hypothetical protein
MQNNTTTTAWRNTLIILSIVEAQIKDVWVQNTN